eukprot:scaffold61254_cov17-Tisochrysis_lutea.AAC.1
MRAEPTEIESCGSLLLCGDIILVSQDLIGLHQNPQAYDVWDETPFSLPRNTGGMDGIKKRKVYIATPACTGSLAFSK